MTELIDLPSRIFDLLFNFDTKFGYKDCMFATIKNGRPIKYNSNFVLKLTDEISIALLQMGIRKGDRIALLAGNSPYWNIIDFATQQIGAILVPIYPNISMTEFDYILEHSGSKAVFFESEKAYVRHKNSIINHIDDAMVFLFEADASNSHHIMHLIQTAKAIRPQWEAVLSEIRNGISPKETATIMAHIYERSAQYDRILHGVPTYYVENMGTIMRDIALIRPEHFSTIPRIIEKIHNRIIQKGYQQKKIKKCIFFWAINLAYQFDETGKENNWFYMKKIFIANLLVFNKVKQVFGGNLKFIISGGAPVQPRLIKFFAAMNCPIIEGYGLTETSPVIATNSYSDRLIKAGTVGIPCGNLDVKIDRETNEILVKGPSVMNAYYKNEEQTRLAFDEEGYFRTGDKGHFDEDGFLVITGRIKEIFKSSMGKFVSPSVIENKMCESPWFNNVIVVGEYQKFAAALIVPNFEQIRLWCTENQIPFTTNEEMAKDSRVNTRIRQEVESINKVFGESEQIKRFRLMDHEWTVESGELTPSLKIRRSAIMEKYKETIEALFA